MSTHYPTPWFREGIYINSRADPQGRTVALAPEGMTASIARWAENGDFIVKAANMHDELVRAVEHLGFLLSFADGMIAWATQTQKPSAHREWVDTLLKKARE